MEHVVVGSSACRELSGGVTLVLILLRVLLHHRFDLLLERSLALHFVEVNFRSTLRLMIQALLRTQRLNILQASNIAGLH